MTNPRATPFDPRADLMARMDTVDAQDDAAQREADRLADKGPQPMRVVTPDLSRGTLDVIGKVRPGHDGPGIDQGTYQGHRVVQAGVSDDALPYYRCRGCGWGRVGGLPDHMDDPCPERPS